MSNQKRPSFINQGNRPLLTCVLSDETSEKCIATVRNAIYDGADAFLLDFGKLDKQYWTYAEIKRIVDYCENKPMLTINYRSPLRPNLTEQEIVDSHLLAASAGVSMCDIQGDILDPSLLELSSDPDIINQQKKLVEKIHSFDCEVLMSSHTWVPMAIEQTINHAKALEERGGDMVKIAMCANTEDELLETIQATILVRRELQLPFLHVCMGQYGKIHRAISPMLGSTMALCVQQYTDRSHKEQPLLRATKMVFDNLDWELAKDTTIGALKGVSNL